MSSNVEKKQILLRMQEKDTEELIQIWKANDRTEWTDTAFDIIREILIERLGELPQQNDGNDQTETADEEVVSYHNPDRLIQITKWARTLSRLFLVLGFLLILANVIATLIGLFSPGSAATSWYDLFLTLYRLANAFVIAFVSLFLFVLLQALAEGICLLMDIEDNTRFYKSENEKTT